MTYNATSRLDAADKMVDDVQQRTGGIMTKQQLMGAQRRNAQSVRVTIAIVGLIAVIALISATIVAFKIAQLESANTLRAASIKILEEANVDRQAIGLPPLPVPRLDETDEVLTPVQVDLRAISDAAAATVLRQIRDDPSFRGPPGQPCDPQTNLQCQGPRGVDSIVPGPTGPAPRCEDEPGESCVGPKGTTGRGISGTAQSPADPCTRVITYTDGTTENWNTCPPVPPEPGDTDGG